jgi:hypothetical protein
VLATKNYPNDRRIRQSVLTRPLYDKSSLTRDRTALILETINRHLSLGSGGFTVLDRAATIEHVLPQTLSSEWKEELGERWEHIYRDYLHTLGNLTLVTQEWNSALSNAHFGVKRPRLASHALRINSDYFSREILRWNEEAIHERGAFLTDKILAIWPSLKPEDQHSNDDDDFAEMERSEPANFHEECIVKVSEHLGKVLLKRSTQHYSNTDGQYRVVCMVSKAYERAYDTVYWYSFFPAQREFLSAASSAFVAYGCGSPDKTILLPYQFFEPLTQNMRTTVQDRKYWHVKIFERENRFYIGQELVGDRVDITDYLLPRPQ